MAVFEFVFFRLRVTVTSQNVSTTVEFVFSLCLEQKMLYLFVAVNGQKLQNKVRMLHVFVALKGQGFWKFE